MMTVTKRSTKGSALTHAEMDANWGILEGKQDALSGVSNVGIGTNVPDDILHIYKANGTMFRVTGANSTGEINGMYMIDVYNYIKTIYEGSAEIGSYHGVTARASTGGAIGETHAFKVLNNTTELFRVSTAGNVGIGTTNPTEKLVVFGATNDDGRIATFLDTTKASNYITIGSVLNNQGVYVGSYDDGARLALGIHGNGPTVNIKNGNVGINETAPDYKLDVNGSFGFTPGSSVTPVDNGDVVIEATSNTTLTFKLKGSDGVVRSGTITLT